MNGLRFATGRTPVNANAWKAYTENCIYIDVDTSSGGFTKAPNYMTSIGGAEEPWIAAGVTAIYPIPPATTPGSGGFRIYIRRRDGAALTPAQAEAKGWYIQWVGVEQ